MTAAVALPSGMPEHPGIHACFVFGPEGFLAARGEVDEGVLDLARSALAVCDRRMPTARSLAISFVRGRLMLKRLGDCDLILVVDVATTADTLDLDEAAITALARGLLGGTTGTIGVVPGRLALAQRVSRAVALARQELKPLIVRNVVKKTLATLGAEAPALARASVDLQGDIDLELVGPLAPAMEDRFVKAIAEALAAKSRTFTAAALTATAPPRTPSTHQGEIHHG